MSVFWVKKQLSVSTLVDIVHSRAIKQTRNNFETPWDIIEIIETAVTWEQYDVFLWEERDLKKSYFLFST